MEIHTGLLNIKVVFCSSLEVTFEKQNSAKATGMKQDQKLEKHLAFYKEYLGASRD